VILLVVTWLMLIVFPRSVEAETSIVYVDPSFVTGLSVGETFPVNVTVANAVDLYAWSSSLRARST